MTATDFRAVLQKAGYSKAAVAARERAVVQGAGVLGDGASPFWKKIVDAAAGGGDAAGAGGGANEEGTVAAAPGARQGQGIGTEGGMAEGNMGVAGRGAGRARGRKGAGRRGGRGRGGRMVNAGA